MGRIGDLTYYQIVDFNFEALIPIPTGHVIIFDCEKAANGELVVPDIIEGLPVSSIGDLACSGCSGLSSMTIPDSITSI